MLNDRDLKMMHSTRSVTPPLFRNPMSLCVAKEAENADSLVPFSVHSHKLLVLLQHRNAGPTSRRGSWLSDNKKVKRTNRSEQIVLLGAKFRGLKNSGDSRRSRLVILTSACVNRNLITPRCDFGTKICWIRLDFSRPLLSHI